MELKHDISASTTITHESEMVGRYYDHQIFDELAELGGGNLHYGYWIDDADDSAFEAAMEHMTAEMIRWLDPRPGDRILDLGCGNGAPAIQLAGACPVTVVGITVSAHQVARARDRAQAAGLADRVRFEQVDAMRMPYPAGSFDRVWAVESMLHMPDMAQVLAETARVLRRGGRFAAADIIYRNPGTSGIGTQAADITQASLTEFSEYQELLENAGFGTVEMTDVTTQTSRTPVSYAQWARSHGKKFVEVFGEDGFGQLLDHVRTVGLLPALRYALITAQRR